MVALLELLDVPVTETQLAAIGCIKRMLENNDANKTEMYQLEGEGVMRCVSLSLCACPCVCKILVHT